MPQGAALETAVHSSFYVHDNAPYAFEEVVVGDYLHRPVVIQTKKPPLGVVVHLSAASDDDQPFDWHVRVKRFGNPASVFPPPPQPILSLLDGVGHFGSQSPLPREKDVARPLKLDKRNFSVSQIVLQN